MFLFFGVDRRERQLDFDQVEVCPVCGRYGHVQVFQSFSCLSLFFIPVFRWGRRYFVRMSCCGATAPLSKEGGEVVTRGRAASLRLDKLRFSGGWSAPRGQSGDARCPSCGRLVAPGYRYCPFCGRQL